MASSSSSAAIPYPCDHFDIDGGVPIGIGALGRVLRVAYCPPASALNSTTTATAAAAVDVGAEAPDSGEGDASPLSPPPITVACKILSKLQLLQSKKVEAIMREKSALLALGPHPLVARLHGTHQSEDELFFFMEEMKNGDLQEHIRRIVGERRGFMTSAGDDGGSAPPSSSSPPSPPSSSSSPWLPGLFCLSFSDVRLILAQLVLGLEHCHVTHTRYAANGKRAIAAAAENTPSSTTTTTATAVPDGDANSSKNSTAGRCYVLRDLKSENVCFDSKGRCVLIDFDCVDECIGLAPESNYGDALGDKLRATESEAAAALRRKSISEIQESRKMSAYNFCGTAQFVSPEVLGQLKWSYSSDLWALGVIAYQLVFGRYPFDGETPFLTMKEIIKGLEGGERHFPAVWAPEAKGAIVLGDNEEGDEGEGEEGTPSTPSPSSTSVNTSSVKTSSTAPPPRYSVEQYALVRSFIEALLVIDPTRRLGVDKRRGGGRGPCYGDLFAHPFFAMATPNYPSSSRGGGGRATVLPPLDWDGLRAMLGISTTTSATTTSSGASTDHHAADHQYVYTFVPLAEAERRRRSSIGDDALPLLPLMDGCEPAGAPSLMGLYDVPPRHEDAYSSHADNVCSSAGPLESYLVGGSVDTNDIANHTVNHNHDAPPAAAEKKNNTNMGGDEEAAECTPSSSSSSSAAVVRQWLSSEWADAYFGDLTNFTVSVDAYEAAPSSSTAGGAEKLKYAEGKARLAATNTKALLLSPEVLDEALCGTCSSSSCGSPSSVRVLSQLYSHWQWCRASLKTQEEEGCTSDGNANNKKSTASKESPVAARRYALAAELSIAGKGAYALLEAAATRLATRAAAAEKQRTAEYLRAVAAQDAERKAQGIAVPLGVNNPYAPYANTPIVIADLAQAIREAEAEARRRGKGDDEDDVDDEVIDDVGADKHKMLQKPDADFSQ